MERIDMIETFESAGLDGEHSTALANSVRDGKIEFWEAVRLAEEVGGGA